MSYIECEAGIKDGVSKAVISFWFRIPKESYNAAKAAAATTSDDPLNGIIPLVVLGEYGESVGVETEAKEVSNAFTWYSWNSDIPVPSIETKILSSFYVSTPDYPILGATGDVLHQILDYVTYGNVNGRYEVVEFFPGSNPQRDFYQIVTEGETSDTAPTAIGVGFGSGEGQLYVNLQTMIVPKMVGTDISKSGVSPGYQYDTGGSSGAVHHNIFEMRYPFSIGLPVDAGDQSEATSNYQADNPDSPGTAPPAQSGNRTPKISTWKDISDKVHNKTANFSNSYDGGSGPGEETEPDGEPTQKITPDHWHHVIVSFEIKPCNVVGSNDFPIDENISKYVTSTSKMWIAVDDVNYTKYDLSPFWNKGGDPNEVVIEDAVYMAGDGPFTPVDDINHKHVGDINIMPDFKVNSKSIPGKNMGFPASVKFVDNIYIVEMADFQMWTGITLDPSKKDNRRVFIDEDGYPVKNNKEAVALLGKKPAIAFRKTSHWKTGNNRGTLGVDNEGKKIPEGQFTPTAKINSWKPEPSLHGPQNPGEKKS